MRTLTKNHLTIGRPWYLSVTALWKDADGFESLYTRLIEDFDLMNKLPGHHKLIRKNSWHSTVFAAVKMNGWDTKQFTAEDYALEALSYYKNKFSGVLDKIKNDFHTLDIEAYELMCFDSGTTIQLKEVNDSLSKFRYNLQKLLEKPVLNFCKDFNKTKFGCEWKKKYGKLLVESLLLDKNKNFGGNAFGSVARSTYPKDTHMLRWREKIGSIQLKFPCVYFLHSDEMLTNPKAIRTAILISR